MSDILVVNGDVIWNSGDLAIVSGDENIKQQAYLRSTCDLGESTFHNDYGSEIFKHLGKSNLVSIEWAAREAILKTKGVQEILEIKCYMDGEETVHVDAKFKTEEGKILYTRI